MAETDFTADVTAENGNNVEEEATQETQEEPNPERKCKDIELDWILSFSKFLQSFYEVESVTFDNFCYSQR